LYNRGTKYLEKKNYLKAISCFKKQLRTHSFKELHLNLANCYRGLNDPSLAQKHYVIANAPSTPFADGSFAEEYSLAMNNLGLLAYWHGDDSLAISWYKKCLTLDPTHADAVWNYGNALLRMSNCSSNAGWQAYEYRFKRSGSAVRIDTSVELWDGVTSGDAICVQTEQGLGDKIMFGRYLPLLAAKFKDVYVVCHPSLDVFYSDYKIVRSVAESGCALTIGICSLAMHFGVVGEKWLEGKFNARKFDQERLNIGVVWSGSPTHSNNANRSCSSHYFSSLANYGNLYNLNPTDVPAKNVAMLKPSTWAETASIVLGLDVVVTVDTSIVHLCGTLGVPCLMIQPIHETDFRWGYGGNTVWYSSVTVVPNNNWDVAFGDVRRILECLKK
jgi:tetratricopeptide (TPR) repeat protein